MKEPMDEDALVLADDETVWERGEGGWYSKINEFGPAMTWEQVRVMCQTLVQVWEAGDVPRLLLQEQWGLRLIGGVFPVVFGDKEMAIQRSKEPVFQKDEIPPPLCRRLVSAWETVPTEE